MRLSRSVATLCALAAVAVVDHEVGSLPAAEAATYRMQGYTTRVDSESGNCTRRRADPINIAFFGTHASWQNTQRAVGYEFHADDRPTRGTRWRTTKGLAGGTQCVLNGTVRRPQDAQSSRGSGFRGGQNAKRHIRFFEQTLAFSLNDDLSERWILTVGDAHRDRKSRRCPGPGAVLGRLNDRVPRLINGRSGYDDGARLFVRGFPTGGAPALTRRLHTGNRGKRYVQCEGSPSTRYTVPWNGILHFFALNKRFGCQTRNAVVREIDAWQPLGNCPSEIGREGTLILK